MKNILKSNAPIVFFFALVFIIGVFTFKDYGIVNDEVRQREHSFVNYYEYMKILDKTPFFDITTAQDKLLIVNTPEGLPITNINDYDHKYYGTAIQMPLVFIEHLFNFNISMFNIFYIRHFYTFCLFLLSLIYFYKLLNKFIVKNKWYALVGTAFMTLSPRIYGDAFYNIKDLVFMSLCTINLYYSLKYINGNRKRDLVALAFISALTTNSRIIGGLILFLTIVFVCIKKGRNIKRKIAETVILAVCAWTFYVIITPAAWEDPFMIIFKQIDFFFFFKDPINHYEYKSYYMGRVFDANSLPWHYLFVWIFVTTPITYSFLFLVGLFYKTKQIIQRNISLDVVFLDAFLWIPLLLFAIFRPTAYNGWRHFYFIYPAIMANVVVALTFILEKASKHKTIVSVLVVVSLTPTLFWMVKNHPHQREYFDVLFESKYVNKFEHYWEINRTNALKHILDNDNGIINIYIISDHNLFFPFLNILDDKYKSRIAINGVISADFEAIFQNNFHINYIIDEGAYPKENKYGDEYEEIKHEHAGQFRLYTIYKRK